MKRSSDKSDDDNERLFKLHAELDSKDKMIASLTLQLKAAQDQLAVGSAIPKHLDNTERSTEALELCDRIDDCVSGFWSGSVTTADLHNAALNLLACIAHARDKSFSSKRLINSAVDSIEEEEATKIAFHAAVRFFSEYSVDSYRDNIPVTWLIGMFPFRNDDHSRKSSWLPLHLFLASSMSDAVTGSHSYLEDLDLLLKIYGREAFQEEVSPLCIAVGKSYPDINIVQQLLSNHPESVLAEDEEGCIALMHACALNCNSDVVNVLVAAAPDSVDIEDNFGCSAIHYAAFYGCYEVVATLLEIAPQCGLKCEGNGAFPLHDAVQNARGYQTQFQITQLLLDLFPESARKVDSCGALPLHRAAQNADLRCFEALHNTFPQALFAADNEGLLPLHYFSLRQDKDQHLDLIQFMLMHNPQCEVKPVRHLMVDSLPKSSNSRSAPTKAPAIAGNTRSNDRRRSCAPRRSVIHTINSKK